MSRPAFSEETPEVPSYADLGKLLEAYLQMTNYPKNGDLWYLVDECATLDDEITRYEELCNRT